MTLSLEIPPKLARYRLTFQGWIVSDTTVIMRFVDTFQAYKTILITAGLSAF